MRNPYFKLNLADIAQWDDDTFARFIQKAGRLLGLDASEEEPAIKDEWFRSLPPDIAALLVRMAETNGAVIDYQSTFRIHIQRCEEIYTVGDTTNRSFIIPFHFENHAFIERVTATVKGLKFRTNKAPDAFFVGNGTISPKDYVSADFGYDQAVRVMDLPVPLSEWTQMGGDYGYIVPVLPFVKEGSRHKVRIEISEDVLSISELTLTLHKRTFPSIVS
jgi:hypothetical protein